MMTATAIGGQSGEYALWRPGSLKEQLLDSTYSRTTTVGADFWGPVRIGTSEVQEKRLVTFLRASNPSDSTTEPEPEPLKEHISLYTFHLQMPGGNSNTGLSGNLPTIPLLKTIPLEGC
jgi:hypothetical protein